LFRRRLPSFVYGYISGQLKLTPEIVPEECRYCRECIKICPTRTIHEIRGKAWVDQAGCIHCLCCHEVCIHRAIRLHQRPVGRIIRKTERLLKMVKKLIGRI
jgi:MinD superfamily P-loop ATPase